MHRGRGSARLLMLDIHVPAVTVIRVTVIYMGHVFMTKSTESGTTQS